MTAKDDLISRVDALSCEDDGIKMNRKLKYIQEFIEKDCTTAQHLWDSFGELNACSLKDSEFGVKVAILISSSTFSTLEMFGLRLRNLLLSGLQENFENAADYLKSDEDQFFNSVNLIGEYYNRARLLNNKPIEILVEPILQYLHMCLDAKSARGAKTLVTQLSINGALIKSSHSSELNKLMIGVRTLLMESNEIPIKVWLMLAIDIVANKFEMSKDYDNFYLEMIKKYELKDSDIPKPKSESVTHKDLTNETAQEITEKLNTRDKKILTNDNTKVPVSPNSNPQPKSSIGDRLKADYLNKSVTTPRAAMGSLTINTDGPNNRNIKNSTTCSQQKEKLENPTSKNSYCTSFESYLNKQ